MTVQLFTPRPPVAIPTHMLAFALLVLGAVLVFGLYLATHHATVISNSDAAVSETSLSQRLAVPAQAPQSTCSVTGDLAGDGNPAEIAAILCG